MAHVGKYQIISTERTDKNFWSHVEEYGDCLIWVGYRNKQGYGRFRHLGNSVQAHRYAYASTQGVIPFGMHVDHHCYNTSCVNPGHLELVTQFENNERAGARITHCKQGHEYTESNTILRNGRHRGCRRCMRIATDRWTLKQKERI